MRNVLYIEQYGELLRFTIDKGIIIWYNQGMKHGGGRKKHLKNLWKPQTNSNREIARGAEKPNSAVD